MVILRARLTPELGAVVQRALDAANQRLYEESRQAAPPESVAEEITPAQRRADALGLLAESALASGLDRGVAADRYQVVLHVEAEPATVSSAGDGPAQAAIELEDGAVRVSAETSRRLACDASVVVIEEGAEGSALDVGRKTRSIPPAIRRALNARDGRCRFPGCTARHCDAHHITHWADGGGTSLDNLLLLCRRHHRLVHEGGIGIERDASGAVTFFRPDGRRIEMAPRLTLTGLPALGIVAGSRGLPCWDGTRFNLAYVVDVLRPSPAAVTADIRRRRREPRRPDRTRMVQP